MTKSLAERPHGDHSEEGLGLFPNPERFPSGAWAPASPSVPDLGAGSRGGGRRRGKGLRAEAPVAMGTRAQPPALPWQRAPPVAGAGAHQSAQVAPSRERGPAGSGGGGGGLGPRPAPPPPGAAAPGRPAPCAYLRGSRPPRDHRPRQGHLYAAAPLLGPPSGRAGALPADAECPPEHLRPAPRPRKCGATAKPRPAPPLFMGTVPRRPRGIARCPAGPCHCHAPPGGDGHSRLSSGRDGCTTAHQPKEAVGASGAARRRPP